ncbi:MAG TPA: ferric reductase-like transmembrane domain-containing protein [Sphingorhabdus sp.]|jgi:sulfoxide reductase heme-binding subunit YedZ|nr:ferric reductase-like transmembrane domain-containing protein [Sphingorhabdus sp.]
MSLFRPKRLLLWFLLALPAFVMLREWITGDTLTMDLLEPSGDMAVRLMILALLPGPLIAYFGSNRILRAWLAIRRNLGVAAFCYALLHLAFYVFDMQTLAAMADELGLPGIWTGWLAFALMIPAAATSWNGAVRQLGRHWKSVQRIVYGAALIAFVHWFLLEPSWLKAAVHAAPLIAVWLLRFVAKFRRHSWRMT